MEKRILSLITILIVISVIFSGCGAKSEEVIKIGAIGPLTGESSIGGIDELAGKELAIEEVNANGGVLGKKLQLFSEDDASQPSQSASAAMKLINQDKVVAIVGAHNSPCTLAVMEVISKQGIPIITPGSSSPKVTSVNNEWVARSFPSDSIQASSLVKYAGEKMGVKRIGLIYVNDDFGKGGFEAIKNAAAENGMEVVAAESFMGEDKDMRTQLTKIKASNVDGLFIWCQYLPGSLVMKQAREMGWDIQFYGSTGIVHPKTFELAGDAYNGTIQTVPFIPNVPDPEKQAWVKRYEEKYGRKPSQNSARAYDGTMILIDAIKRAGSTDPKAIRDAMRNTKDFPSLQGNITIEPSTGEYIGDVMIVKSENNDWTYLDLSSSK